MQSTTQSLVSIQAQLLNMVKIAPRDSELNIRLFVALRELNSAIQSLQSQPTQAATPTVTSSELYSAYDLELDAVNAAQKSR